MDDGVDFSKKTKSELIKICKLNNIKGYSSKSKEEIIETIKEYISGNDSIKCEMVFPKWDNIDDVLKILAKKCIDENLYRKGNTFHNIDRSLLKVINKNNTSEDKIVLLDGYMFLDEKNGNEGMIRLYDSQYANPKWSFWVKDGEINVDYA